MLLFPKISVLLVDYFIVKTPPCCNALTGTWYKFHPAIYETNNIHCAFLWIERIILFLQRKELADMAIYDWPIHMIPWG